jgi:antitoxin component HigA of HigAB toxin-antitoxin module
MQIAPIVTEADYIDALIEIGRLIATEADHGTSNGDRLEALTCCAAAFEAQDDVPSLAEIGAR